MGEGAPSVRPNQETLLAHSKILENMAEGVNVSDQHGVIFFTNPAFEKMFGYEPGELQGQHVAVLNALCEEDNSRLVGEIIGSLKQCGQWAGEFQNRRKDGTEFTTRARITQVNISGNSYWVSVQEDVTEKRQLEEQIRRSQKMEALGRLAGGVAHDFNNILVSVLTHADLLCQGFSASDPRRKDAEEILRAARSARDLTKQLLLFSRQQRPKAEVVEVVAAINDMSGMLRRLLGEEFPLQTELPSEPCPVLIDRTQLEQVLLNLVLNARDASHANQTVVLRVDATRHGRGAVLIEVEDRGSGMSPEVESRVFEPFFTTKEPGKGTGLGLSTVLGIVQTAGGRIEIKSTLGVGSTVQVELPRAAVWAAAPRLETSSQPPRSQRNLTVLVVEDDPHVFETVSRTLTDAGYRVLRARDGIEALELAKPGQVRVDLLLSDVRMPRMNGPELAERLVVEHPDAQVLFMSGYPGSITVQGGAGFVEKPFTAAELLHAVSSMLGWPRASTPCVPGNSKPLYVVDGFNILHAVVLKGRERARWWSAANQEKVVRLAERFDRGEVCVVFDAAKATSERFDGERSVSVYFAPSADDHIVQMSQQNVGERQVVVVSADRALIDRAKQHGALRMSPWNFWEKCSAD